MKYVSNGDNHALIQYMRFQISPDKRLDHLVTRTSKATGVCIMKPVRIKRQKLHGRHGS